MKTCLLFWLVAILLTGCGIARRSEEAQNIVENYFGEVEITKDEVIPLASGVEEFLKPGEIFVSDSLMIRVLSIEEDKNLQHLLFEMEIFNEGDKSIEFNQERHLKIFEEVDAAGAVYRTVEKNIPPKRLSGIIQSGNRISGVAAFPMPSMTDNRIYLAVGEDESPVDVAFEITRGDLGSVFDPIFKNGQILTGYTVGTTVESDMLDVTINDVTYQTDDEGVQIARCLVTVVNNTDVSALFLEGFTLPYVHDAQGNALAVISGSITLPKIIEADQEATGIVPVILDTGERDFYVTVRPDEKKINDMAVIFVNDR